MDAKFLKVVILAMDADGDFQQEELDMLKQVINAHPEFKGITNEDGIEVMGELYNKLSVGMERKHILEQLGEEFNQNEKETAFALAKEICASDFKIMPAETDFLSLMCEMWSIPDDVVQAVNRSIALRYSI